jgi:hypothetical protein
MVCVDVRIGARRLRGDEDEIGNQLLLLGRGKMAQQFEEAFRLRVDENEQVGLLPARCR